MVYLRRNSLIIILFCVLFSLSPVGMESGQEEDFGIGLKLASPDQLLGIPLAFTPYSGDELPSFVDLSADMPPAGNQGKQNSCVGWAIAYAVKSYQEKVEERQPIVRNGRVDPNRVFSPAFIYNQINNGRNVPTYYSDAFNILSEQGVATWADFPYSVSDYTSQPSYAVKERAKRYRIDFWRQVNIRDTKEIKAHLHAGYPVMVGIKVDRAFIKHPAGQIWNSIGPVIGGHAMVIVGYSDRLQAFKLINSWGPEWGDNGYCWVDYDHFRRIANEGYVAKDAKNGPPPSKVRPDRPQPRPRDPSIVVTKVEHNTYYPDKPELGYFMKFEGTIDIPPGKGYKDQIVIHFYLDQGGGQPGTQVQSLDSYYADTNGYVACGTALYDIPPQGLTTTWQTWVPYNAFNVPRGQYVNTDRGRVYQKRRTNLVAVPTLFVDNFGVAQGKTLLFSINW